MQHSLFIGRWQPFHGGHKALLETRLKHGKPIIVAIRDTERGEDNPYTVPERWGMIAESLIEYASLVRIIVIPDIDEVCYGRKAGYDVCEVSLDDDIEAISATKIRSKSIIVWLTGNSGAGKTTLARQLKKRLGNSVMLDGDVMRASISLGAGFSRQDRDEHNLRVARLAQVLRGQHFNVIVSVIAPFQETRNKIDQLISPIWVYVKRDLPLMAERPYEIPSQPSIVVDTDRCSPRECVDKILYDLEVQ